MDTVNGMDDLKAKIKNLERIEAQQLEGLKVLYGEFQESLSPKRILQSTFKNVVETPGLRTTVLDTAISLGAGFLTKKVVIGKSGNIFRKLAGLATQFLVTNLVRNKIPDLKDKSNGIHTTIEN